jgi:type IV pilus assembly protein PilW
MNKKNTAKGFSLLELLIAMLIGLIVLLSTYGLFSIQSRHLSMQEQKAEMLQNARAGLDLMTQEILMAACNPTGSLAACTGTNNATNTPCVGLTAISSSTLSFSSDLDGDGNLTADSTNPNENIMYDVYTSGGKSCLGRTSNGSKQPVVENISALLFTYLDASNNVTTNLALVKKIRVSITAQAAKPNINQTYPTVILSSDVMPRNLNN